MGDWDWGSSDIGSGSSGGFSSGDYYWTGGKFTDWSGNSMGKFDWNSGNGYPSSDGDGSYGIPTGLVSESKKKEWIENEKRHGLHEGADDFPVFLSVFGLAWRAVGFYLPVALFAYVCWIYTTKYNIPETNFVLGMFICMIVLPTLLYMFFFVDGWYPRPRNLTKGGLRRFLVFVDWLKLSCSLLSMLLILTPLWRYLGDSYFEELYNMQEHYWYHYEHFELEWFHYVCMPFFFLAASLPFLNVVFKPLSGKESVERRWEYMRYKMGQLSEAEKARLEKIADLKKQLETKQKEVLQLCRQIAVLQNNLNE